jgi:hypothetical protein
VKNRAEVGFSSRGGLFEYVYDVAYVSCSTAWRENFPNLGVKGDKPYAIGLFKYHVRQAGR